MQETFVPTFKAHENHCIHSIRLECQNKYFLIWISSSVNKSIIFDRSIEVLTE